MPGGGNPFITTPTTTGAERLRHFPTTADGSPAINAAVTAPAEVIIAPAGAPVTPLAAVATILSA